MADAGRKAQEMLAQITWIEACGWTMTHEGLWRHESRAGDAPVSLVEAFALEQDAGPPSRPASTDTPPP